MLLPLMSRGPCTNIDPRVMWTCLTRVAEAHAEVQGGVLGGCLQDISQLSVLLDELQADRRAPHQGCNCTSDV